MEKFVLSGNKIISAGGLNGPFEACEDEVSSDDMDCDVDQKARVFPYSSCRDLAVNDELPTKDDMKNKNPCKGAMVNWKKNPPSTKNSTKKIGNLLIWCGCRTMCQYEKTKRKKLHQNETLSGFLLHYINISS